MNVASKSAVYASRYFKGLFAVRSSKEAITSSRVSLSPG
ncbi:Uncharacterised protein [Mycobacteroides abscessus subsp. abscessus]|nr:Uncharacterised protein [Mycobacteroides abscessus subsp. abscessus]